MKTIIKSEDKDMKYVKHPATWLNAGDWRQEIETKKNPKDCVDCGSPYEQGFKYTTDNGRKQYRCPACQEANKEAGVTPV